MTTTIAWILNLDADLELADPAGFRVSSRQRAQVAALGGRFLDGARRVAPPGVRHVELAALDRATDGGAVVCQAWCPTGTARARAAGAGRPLTGPPPAILQRVNHRSFAAALAGGTYVRTMAEFEAAIREPRPGGWLLQRPFGFSGRGRKHIDGPLTPPQRRWAEASMTGYGGGLQVAPFVDIATEYALHGWLSPDGRLLAGAPTTQDCDADGAWLASRPAPDLTGDDLRAMHNCFTDCAAALGAAGYHGPFSIDAYRYREPDDRIRLLPLSELNARYSMGWFVGMAGQQADWIAALTACCPPTCDS